MENPSYIALSRQMGLQHQMDVVANNLANMNSVGFKAEKLMFREYLQKPDSGLATSKNTFAMTEDYGVAKDLNKGVIKSTGRMFDVAIANDGYFVIDTTLGERYTRAGNWAVSEDGQLVTTQGYPVLGEGGPITIPEDEGVITIAADGQISSEQGVVGQLRVVEFADEQKLRKAANGLYIAESQVAINAERPDVRQGHLEMSNVTPVSEITTMIQVQREFEAVQRMVQTEHTRQREAIRKLAGVN